MINDKKNEHNRLCIIIVKLINNKYGLDDDINTRVKCF